jgi:hypothetical protein
MGRFLVNTLLKGGKMTGSLLSGGNKTIGSGILSGYGGQAIPTVQYARGFFSGNSRVLKEIKMLKDDVSKVKDAVSKVKDVIGKVNDDVIKVKDSVNDMKIEIATLMASSTVNSRNTKKIRNVTRQLLIVHHSLFWDIPSSMQKNAKTK